MNPALARRLVPDELWAVVEPSIPPAKRRPQGGGRSRVEDRPVFVAVVFILTAPIAWRQLPRWFGVATPTAYRRFGDFTRWGVWRALSAYAETSGMTWARDIADAATTRATIEGEKSIFCTDTRSDPSTKPGADGAVYRQ